MEKKYFQKLKAGASKPLPRVFKFYRAGLPVLDIWHQIVIHYKQFNLPLYCCLLSALLCGGVEAASDDQASWRGDLSPIPASVWNKERARHLLERAGFGGIPDVVSQYANLKPREAVLLLMGKGFEEEVEKRFPHSGIYEEGIDPFPSSRPATTELAKKNGEALGIQVNQSARPLQAIVNQFFYWLRASRLETDRVAYWWADRLLNSKYPVVDKMALFWHGHFAVNEDKVRDYRKMLKQLSLFYSNGLGNFRELMIGVAQDPAMLSFLDAGVNVKGSPNENFAREIMELFTMGPGNYTEFDIREGARAFTGWNFNSLEFVINSEDYDSGEKKFLGRVGNLNGVDVIDIILEQPVTAEFLASKIYKYFVNENLSDVLRQNLGSSFRSMNYEIRPFLEMLFLSKDFYASENIGSRIKSPVEFVISTYKKLELSKIPGSPDFNLVTGALGQRLMHPPTVAGWSYGNSWITPSLLIERGNFALNLMFPDIEFIPQDKYPVYPSGPEIISVHQRLRKGYDITAASQPPGLDFSEDMMAMSNDMSTQENFNTRYASYRGWQKAIEKVIPIPRHLAKIDLTKMVLREKLLSTEAVVSYFEERFLTVGLDEKHKVELARFLESELGTNDISSARSYMEESLRMLLHLILSTPEYQLG